MKGHLRAPPGALCGQTVTPQPSARSPCPCTRGHPFVFSSTHPPRAPPPPTAPVAPAKTASSSPALARCVWSRPAAPPSRRGSHQSLRLCPVHAVCLCALVAGTRVCQLARHSLGSHTQMSPVSSSALPCLA